MQVLYQNVKVARPPLCHVSYVSLSYFKYYPPSSNYAFYLLQPIEKDIEPKVSDLPYQCLKQCTAEEQGQDRQNKENFPDNLRRNQAFFRKKLLYSYNYFRDWEVLGNGDKANISETYG